MAENFDYTFKRLIDAIRASQMSQAQSISDQVPRGNIMDDLFYRLPELRHEYQPSSYYNYGKPVRVG